jgi:signal transduction histidine kinase/CheY-like chemotaxis protein
MKTANEYLKHSIFPLIILFIVFDFLYGILGVFSLFFSQLFYIAFIGYKYLPIILSFFFGAGILLIVAIAKKYSLLSKIVNHRFYSNEFQHFGADNDAMIFMAEHAVGIKKTAIRTNSTNSQMAKKINDEQAIVLVSSGCIMFANKAFFKITGYEPLDVFGKDFASFVRPESLLSYTMLSRLHHLDLQRSGGIGISTMNNSNVIAFVGESKHSQYKAEGLNVFCLKQVAQTPKGESSHDTLFFESIENVEALLWIWDEKGMIYLNNSCRKHLPFSLGMILDKPGLMLKSVRKCDRGTIRKALGDYHNTGKFNQEICCIQQNGTEKYFRVTITPQSENKSFPKRNHAIAYDITEEKLTLLKAYRAAQLAEMANNNKTAFLANMSHEIRSPLNGIIGFSELLADKNLTDAERERYLDIIQNNGNVLITLLSDLIDISKLESGNLVTANRKFCPAKLLEELKLQFEGSATRKSDNICLVFNNNLFPRLQEINTDANRLRQILVNLITNAIKFTPKGTIEIGADFLGEDMMFWVKDSGIGISDENQNAIFERFRQVGMPDSSPAIGFGLGLAITKALVELLGGRIWVESVLGQGSLFVFTVKTNIATPIMETDLKPEMEPETANFSEHTILIAEDIDFSFQYLDALLSKTGAKTLWAKNGQEAIDFVNSNPDIDLVLMDMHMPVMDGYQASVEISKIRPELTIIAQTAFVLRDDIEKCYASGCSGLIAKPFRRNLLYETLAEYFEKISHSAKEKLMDKR